MPFLLIDILTHNSCMKKYLLKYDRKIESVMNNLSKEEHECNNSEDVKKAFEEVVSELDLKCNGYSVTYVREKMSEKLGSNDLMTNRYVKKLLIDYFGGQICFTYPTNQRISQMFFFYNADQCTLVETLRTTKHSQYLLELKSEFMKYDFALSNSYCDPQHVKIYMENFKSSRPPSWMEFLKYLFSGRNIFASNPTLMLKLDTLYQIIYFTLRNGRRPTPMHVHWLKLFIICPDLKS